MQVLEEIECNQWNQSFGQEIQAQATQALEKGQILHFERLPFSLSKQEERFLTPAYATKNAKNISYNPTTDLLQGMKCAGQEYDELRNMMQRFANHADHLIRHLFPHYANSLKMGRTSFRPVEIAGRVTSYRKDDTRLHVDAFPSSPNQGQRILRVFTNINPHGQSRLWRVGEPFSDVAERFLPSVRKAWKGSSTLLKMLKITKSYRTEYDHIMLQIHNRMKADLHYQIHCPQASIAFAPGSSWIVQTDHVSHAAMAGQYVLEQTFYLPIHAMLNPLLSPLRILESKMGKKLAYV